MQRKGSSAVYKWLMLGVILVFIQVLIGGTTRLTGSGLSITKWDIVTGTIPPLNLTDWTIQFDHYKETDQYKKLNAGMDLSQFKSIYFWEYLHRLWARSLGFVFLIPFLIFWRKGYFNKDQLRKTFYLFILGALVGLFGWIMVASGLLPDKTTVNPYRLAIHLGLALITLTYTYYLALDFKNSQKNLAWPKLNGFAKTMLWLISIQIMLGAMVSGMKAALFYPTWPNMNGSFIPQALAAGQNWSLALINNWDSSAFAPALFQFLHRGLAYFIVAYVLVFVIRNRKEIFQFSLAKKSLNVLMSLIGLQIILGISTLLLSIGSIPVFLGVAHQGVAILILLNLIFIFYHSQPSRSPS